MSKNNSGMVGFSQLNDDKEPAGSNQGPGKVPNPDPPITPTEIKLHQIWSSALSQELIGRGDNFIVLGGDSLSLAQVITEVETEFKVVLPVEVVASNLTLKDMAGAIDKLVGKG